MRRATLTVPEVGLIAATRGMAGAGAALLLANRLSPKKRRMIGWPLFMFGALSTVPIALNLMRKSRCAELEETVEPLAVVNTVKL